MTGQKIFLEFFLSRSEPLKEKNNFEIDGKKYLKELFIDSLFKTIFTEEKVTEEEMKLRIEKWMDKTFHFDCTVYEIKMKPKDRQNMGFINTEFRLWKMHEAIKLKRVMDYYEAIFCQAARDGKTSITLSKLFLK